MTGPALEGRLAGIGGGAPLYPLAVLFGLNAVDELDRAAFGILLPEVKDAFGLSVFGAFLLTTAILPMGLIASLPIAYLADRRRRVPIAVTGAATWATFSVLTGLAPTVVLLGAARIGAGLGRAVNDPVHGSLLSDYYPPPVRAKVFGTHRAANTVGAFFGPLVAGVAAAAWGWRIPFFLLAIPTLVLLVAATRLREPERTGGSLTEGPPRFREGMAVLWGVPTLRRIWLAVPFLAVVLIGLAPTMALFYEDVFGIGPALRGIIQAGDAPFILLGFVVGAPLLDRGLQRDPGMVMRRIGIAAAAIGALIAGVAVAPNVWVAVGFTYAIVVLGAVLLAGGTAVISLIAPPEARASAFALYGVFALAGVVSLPLVGWVGGTLGLRWGIAVLAPVLVVGGLIVSSSGRTAAADVAAVALRDEHPASDT